MCVSVCGVGKLIRIGSRAAFYAASPLSPDQHLSLLRSLDADDDDEDYAIVMVMMMMARETIH